MSVRNNNVPSTDFCGTPEVTGEEGDVAPSQMTVWTLLVHEKGFHPRQEVSMDTVKLQFHLQFH